MAATPPLKARVLRPAARALIAAERLWRDFWPGQACIAAYLAAAGFGLLADVGWPVRLLALALALAGAGWSGWRLLRRFRFPARAEAERRIERAGGLGHRPFQALADLPATTDARAAAAWAIHVRRMADSLRRVRLGAADFALTRHDPFGFRYAVLLLLIAAVAVGWSDFGPRLRGAVQVWPMTPSRPSAVELWIDPPAYTGAAPMRPTAALTTLAVPTGSRLKAVAESDKGALRLVAGADELAFEPTETKGEYALETVLTTSGRLALIDGAGAVLGEWSLEIVPDLPPEAAFAGPPAIAEGGAMRFDFTASDDYGVASADIPMAPADGAPPGGYTAEEALPAPVPQNVKTANGAMFRDLTAHRWAGRTVEFLMRATDAIGQSGQSAPLQVKLPERAFQHPVAQQIIAARKRLDANPQGRAGVARAIGALMRAPEAYGGDVAAMAAMGLIEARLLLDEAKRSYVLARDLMWETALRLEDGDLSTAERALRQARERLAEALARDAQPEEIAKLIAELKEAVNRFAEAMARAQANDTDVQPASPEAQTLSSQDLMQMLDQIRQLSEAGALDAARAALAEVDRILEQLAQARLMRQDMAALREMLQGLQDLQELIRRQQGLMDETFQQQSQLGEPGRPGQRGQDGAPRDEGTLADRQEALRRALGDAMRRMGEGGEIPEGLGRAERAMRDAVGGLGEGDGPGALDAQGQALQHLRDAAQGMAQELARQMGGGQGGGFTMGPGGGSSGGQDPLGRALGRQAAGTVAIPNASDLQRARAIRDEVRRRAGERARPAIERDYLERLLERF